jgi:DNA-binding HxlR family transcriptional regulator
MDSIRNDQTCLNNLKLLGDFWTLRIIDALADGQMRFCEVQRALNNLNPVTLTGRLKKLEESGLINRYEDLEDKVAVVYALTPMGKDALKVINAINDFSAKATLV